MNTSDQWLQYLEQTWEKSVRSLTRSLTQAPQSSLSYTSEAHFGGIAFSLSICALTHFHWYNQICRESNETMSIYSKYAQSSRHGELIYSEETLQETSYQGVTKSNPIQQNKKQSLDLYHKVKQVLSRNPYHPSLYCLYDIRGQLQTGIQYFLRNLTRLLFQTALFQHTEYFVEYDREIIKLPDQGTVAIDWVIDCVENPNERARNHTSSPPIVDDRPILIIHHGLNGDSQAEYFYHLLAKLRRSQKYSKIGILIARGCGGLPLTSFTTFSGRRSYDLFYVVRYVKKLYPARKLFWIGYSLGAAITLHYLEDFPHLLEEEEEEREEVRQQEGLRSSLSTERLTLENLQKHNQDPSSASPSRNSSVHDFLTLETTYLTSSTSYQQLKEKEKLQKQQDRKKQQQRQETSGIDAALCVCPPWNLDRQALGWNLWSMLMIIPLKIYFFQHLEEFRQFNPFPDNPDIQDMTIKKLFFLRDINELDQACYRYYGANYSLDLLRQTTNDALEFHSFFNHQHQQHQPPVIEKKKDCHVHIRHKGQSSADISMKEEGDLLQRSNHSQSVGDCTDTSGFTSSSREGSVVEEAEAMGGEEATVRYRSLEEYYLDTSPKYKAHQITTPTLAISARDDPICSSEECPQTSQELGSGLVVVTTKYGGHLAFPNGLITTTNSWIDGIVEDWFDQF